MDLLQQYNDDDDDDDNDDNERNQSNEATCNSTIISTAERVVEETTEILQTGGSAVALGLADAERCVYVYKKTSRKRVDRSGNKYKPGQRCDGERKTGSEFCVVGHYEQTTPNSRTSSKKRKTSSITTTSTTTTNTAPPAQLDELLLYTKLQFYSGVYLQQEQAVVDRTLKSNVTAFKNDIRSLFESSKSVDDKLRGLATMKDLKDDAVYYPVMLAAYLHVLKEPVWDDDNLRWINKCLFAK
jgi:hypothetical protein